MPQGGRKKRDIAGLRLKLRAGIQEAVDKLHPGAAVMAMQIDRIVMTEEKP
jgi:hypothetical protein